MEKCSMTKNYLKKKKGKKTKMLDEKDLMDNNVELVRIVELERIVEVDTQDKQVEDSIQDCTLAGVDEAYFLLRD